MPTDPNYSHGRLSAPVIHTLNTSDHPQHTDYPLVQALRAIRLEGDSDLSAAEAYDPDFSVKLSATIDADEAGSLLDAWFDRRAAVLRSTRDRLHATWQRARIRDQAT